MRHGSFGKEKGSRENVEAQQRHKWINVVVNCGDLSCQLAQKRHSLFHHGGFH